MHASAATRCCARAPWGAWLDPRHSPGAALGHIVLHVLMWYAFAAGHGAASGADATVRAVQQSIWALAALCVGGMYCCWHALQWCDIELAARLTRRRGTAVPHAAPTHEARQPARAPAHVTCCCPVLGRLAAPGAAQAAAVSLTHAATFGAARYAAAAAASGAPLPPVTTAPLRHVPWGWIAGAAAAIFTIECVLWGVRTCLVPRCVARATAATAAADPAAAHILQSIVV